MHCYLIEGGSRKRYAGTMDAAIEVQNTMAEEAGANKRSFSICQEDIPTGKSNLLAFLNELCETFERAAS